MNFHIDDNKDTPEEVHDVLNEDNNIEDGIVGKAKDDGRIIINGTNENGEGGTQPVVEAQGVLQVEEQHVRASVVCWEQFLHLRSIRVLLVENDDSTRYIVTALLRNCNYEVIEAPNGVLAWRILEDLANHIDLILTEVVMPGLSGLGLLYKIMNHKTRKNVPIIMMSSHDSMGLVFKCLSKGAVDFLVKPIRKNELKNLWQHVWRRCQSSSGSGSESGTQSQDSVQLESNARLDNNSESKNESTGLNIRNRNADGSGTQRMDAKQGIQVDSSLAASPRKHITECHNNVCAHVMHSNTETSGNEEVPATIECPRETQDGNVIKAKDMIKTRTSTQLHFQNAAHGALMLAEEKGKITEKESSQSSKAIDNMQANGDIQYLSSTHKAIITRIPCSGLNSGESETPREPVRMSNYLSKERVIELSLKRLRGVNDTEKTFEDDRNSLRRSEPALSRSKRLRYNTTSFSLRAPKGINESSSLLANGPDILQKVSICDNLPASNGSSSNNDIDNVSSTSKLSTNLAIMKEKAGTRPMITDVCLLSTSMPINDDRKGASHLGVKIEVDYATTSAIPIPEGGLQQDLPFKKSHQLQLQLQHHQFYHMQRPSLSNYDDSWLNKLAVDAPECGSANILVGSFEGNGNPLNSCLNGSASGSNHGSNWQRESNNAINAVGTNVEIVGLAGGTGSGDTNGKM